MHWRTTLATLGAVALACGAAADDAAAPPVAAEEQPASAVVAVPADSVPLRYLIGDVDPARDSAFSELPEHLRSGRRMWGHTDAVAALVRMAEAAAKEGVTLRVVSAFRSFTDQQRIWEDKWNGKTLVSGARLPETHAEPMARARRILEYSSMPATSRHHWGTDFDLNSLDNAWFETGAGKKLHQWLVAHGAEFGFCQVYGVKGTRRATGYEEERWHWSYLPVATSYLAQYPVVVGYERIRGFAGHETAAGIDVIGQYVQAIDPGCGADR